MTGRTVDLLANPRALSDEMDFDHVIEVLPDGTIIDRPDVYAPELYGVSGGTETIEGWTLLTGYSGQDRYSGPIMHNSEQIAGGIARDVLGTPGVYVALVCLWEPEDDDDPEDGPVLEGWAIARKVDA